MAVGGLDGPAVVGRSSEQAPSTSMSLGSEHCSDPGLAPLSVVLENERDLQENAIFGDLALVDHDLLTLHPCPSEVSQGLLRAGDADVDRIVEALRRRGLDLGDLRDAHELLRCEVPENNALSAQARRDSVSRFGILFSSRCTAAFATRALE